MSSLIIVLFVFALAVYKLLRRKTVRWVKTNKYGGVETAILRTAPGPVCWPIIGSLHLLGGHESPFQAFTELSKKYGDIFSVKLGSADCVVVNNLSLIREVLNQNGNVVAGRPDFLRFHKLFAGDRNNSLALCDWSNLQLRRRNLARRHCGPKQHTDSYARIGTVGTFESVELIQTLKGLTSRSDASIDLKPILMKSAMNMFSNYMCSVRFDDEDLEFQKIVDHFDEIFWEINQGYAVDFLPWLAPFYKKHMEKLSNWSQDIRSFILSRIVEQREINLDTEAPEKDFLDGLLRVLHEDPTMDRNTIIFMLEDFLGGHSSVGNLVMLCLTAVARDPEVGRKIRQEIDAVTRGKRPVGLTDRSHLPYTEATILECLRYASSPIVPHVGHRERQHIPGTESKRVLSFLSTTTFLNNFRTVLVRARKKFRSEPVPCRRPGSGRRRNSQCDSGPWSRLEKKAPVRQLTSERGDAFVKKNIPNFHTFQPLA
uniref:Cytochrome P450 n=1 Tax=Bombyx mori TaxID=7091 RepID=L0N744_BOMMO|nr:cytochrome P450 [Bombyx mori]